MGDQILVAKNIKNVSHLGFSYVTPFNFNCNTYYPKIDGVTIDFYVRVNYAHHIKKIQHLSPFRKIQIATGVRNGFQAGPFRKNEIRTIALSQVIILRTKLICPYVP